MNINELRSEAERLGYINKSREDLIESFIQKLIIIISRNIRNLFSRLSTIKQNIENYQNNEHQLLLEEATNKLKRGELMSGGINLVLFSILIMIGVNISKTVTLLFISILQSGSLGIKQQGIVIPIIN